ncbi:MAG: DEAD/DEAH box helicase [Burkholderiales bacterium]|nr:DEAD/DEAH box helicase [Burkholderiales bacterium]
MSFESLNLHAQVLRAITDAGYDNATEVQSRAIPLALEGADLRVCSSTGSGKTAAFMIPALQLVLRKREEARLARVAADTAKGIAPDANAIVVPAAGHDAGGPDMRQARRNQRRNTRFDAPRTPAVGPHVLVLAPTRELAQQVAKAAETYGRHVPGLRVGLVVGGMPYPAQLHMLRASLDILIATPGRLIDHLESGAVRFGEVEMFVLDEADRMLDMGFIEPIEHIAKALPQPLQTLMFSATFAGPVGRLAAQLMKPDAQRIEVSSHTERHDNIAQELIWADDWQHKNALLDHILADTELQQALVFTSTQRDADELAARLADSGHAVAPLHGGMPQGMRNRTLMALRRGDLRVLVATDVAARGIDVPTISHVINYGLPMKAEDYVHRIGRTGRAGRNGIAITLCERRDSSMIRRIQHFTTQVIAVATREGLESRRPVPRLDTPHVSPRPGARNDRGARPAFGQRDDRRGPPSFDHGRPPAPRPEQRGAGFYGAPRAGHDAGAPRGNFHAERPAFGAPDHGYPRTAQAPRGPMHRDDAPRGPARHAEPFGGDRPRADRPWAGRPGPRGPRG